ncbi:MAG TPA: hypothetical protein PKH07_14440, partial [bacterium]|nr:hypothetical protein [bacterium]
MVTQTKLHPRFEKLLRYAMSQGASDLFLIPGEPPALRVRGLIERTEDEILTADEISEFAREAVGEETLTRVGTEVGEIHRSCSLTGEANARMSIASCCGQ